MHSRSCVFRYRDGHRSPNYRQFSVEIKVREWLSVSGQAPLLHALMNPLRNLVCLMLSHIEQQVDSEAIILLFGNELRINSNPDSDAQRDKRAKCLSNFGIRL